MQINDQTKKLLNRIQSDSPLRGDGEEFLKLLQGLETGSLMQSRCKDEIQTRWKQGESFAYENLLKMFQESWGERKQ